jgi:hypothetical protein
MVFIKESKLYVANIVWSIVKKLNQSVLGVAVAYLVASANFLDGQLPNHLYTPNNKNLT